MNGSSHIKIIAEGLRFPEGPAFASNGSLWTVELKGQSLVRNAEGSLQRYHVGGAPNAIAFDKKGDLWFCDSAERSLRKFVPVNETVIMAGCIAGEAFNKPNDLAFDRQGNLVFTCPGDSRKEPIGYVCLLSTDGGVKKIITGKYFPNVLAFTPDVRDW